MRRKFWVTASALLAVSGGITAVASSLRIESFSSFSLLPYGILWIVGIIGFAVGAILLAVFSLRNP